MSKCGNPNGMMRSSVDPKLSNNIALTEAVGESMQVNSKFKRGNYGPGDSFQRRRLCTQSRSLISYANICELSWRVVRRGSHGSERGIGFLLNGAGYVRRVRGSSCRGGQGRLLRLNE